MCRDRYDNAKESFHSGFKKSGSITKMILILFFLLNKKFT